MKNHYQKLLTLSLFTLAMLAVVFSTLPPASAAEKTAAKAEQYDLLLDWFPNADHVPLYVAVHGGFFRAEGLEIRLIPPADPNDPLKLVAAGRIPFAINYQPQVTISRSRGLPVRAISSSTSRGESEARNSRALREGR